MDALLGLLILIAFGVGVYTLARNIILWLWDRLGPPRVERQQQHRQVQSQHTAVAQRNRDMQLAIQQLESSGAPDFRRAATAAAQAHAVPVEFRRRQYQRLRPLLLAHYVRCLRRECDPELLHTSLVELVEALGMSDYEADYIRQEADQRQSRRRPQQTGGSANEFQARLQQLQREHERRLQAIRDMQNLTDDVRQQLIEAEEQRFQSQLFGRTESS